MTEITDTSTKKLTLGQAISDISFFSIVFALVVSGPSVLSILQTVFLEHKLSEAFQWVVDGYNTILSVIGAIIEPLLRPAISWLSQRLNIDLELQPYWRPLFVLAMVYVVARVRTLLHFRRYGFSISSAVIMTAGVLLGSIAAGLVPVSSNWWIQGSIAALPLVALELGKTFDDVVIEFGKSQPQPMNDISRGASSTAFVGFVAFMAGAAASFLPGLGTGAGVLVVAGSVLTSGVGKVYEGVQQDNSVQARIGLMTMGGFIAAAIVLLADLLLTRLQASAFAAPLAYALL